MDQETKKYMNKLKKELNKKSWADIDEEEREKELRLYQEEIKNV
tara:strand:+ start:43 stop:174 length:132 start_codon:yes stop_codon:yes gene_type:complete